ncbi:MAG: mitochondrial fission ELM1 family protein [Rickettsiales bacterium]|nr:mitochondrial fission ELM1 family protein [Rickettsiales bacterium]
MGSSKQAKALARALGGSVTIKNIVYNPFIHLPNIIKPYRIGVNFKESSNLLSGQEAPDIIIFGGRRLAGIGIFLRKHFESKFNKKVWLIAILDPNYDFKSFDFVILPLHDKINFRRNRDNVVYINGSLCDPRISVADSVRDYWNKKLENARTPFFSLMIGGNVRQRKMDPLKLGSMVRKVSAYVAKKKGTLLVSSSRRTGAACLEETRKSLDCDHYIYEWAENSCVPNPYYLFVEKSSAVFITGDSISMVSEVATMGRPTYILYVPEEFAGLKQERFCKSLEEAGLAKKISPNSGPIEEFQDNRSLNELERLSELIKNNILGHAAAL